MVFVHSSRTSRCVLILTLVPVFASCGHSSEAPTSPTVTSNATATLTIGGNLALTIHQTSQLSATLPLPDGTARDVTAEAQWHSTNPAVATITPGGLLTAAGLGATEIDAVYQKARSPVVKVSVTLDPRGYTVSGIVRETGGEPVVGARVTCCHGTFNDDKVATTDARGRYSIDSVSGNTQFGVYPPNNSHEEFKVFPVSVTTDTALDVTLSRRLEIQAGENVSSSVAWDDTFPWLGCEGPCRIITILGPGDAGTLRARLEWNSPDRLALLIADDDDGTDVACCESGEILQFHYRGHTTWIIVSLKTPQTGGMVPFTVRTTLER